MKLLTPFFGAVRLISASGTKYSCFLPLSSTSGGPDSTFQEDGISTEMIFGRIDEEGDEVREVRSVNGRAKGGRGEPLNEKPSSTERVSASVKPPVCQYAPKMASTITSLSLAAFSKASAFASSDESPAPICSIPSLMH